MVGGKVETFKTRQVAKEFTQKEGIDREETIFLVEIYLDSLINCCSL